MFNVTIFPYILVMVSLFIVIKSLPEKDQVVDPPGMPNQTIYSGYLSTTKSQLHYLFIQSQVNHTVAPLVIWFNRHPGCSNLYNVLTSIGPYLIGQSYLPGDKLLRNQYGWNKVSNLLFIESPGITGFSGDKDKNHLYNDSEISTENYFALKDFLLNKGKQFENRDFYLTGINYAGKMIPDLANLILKDSKFNNFKGILIGNGYISDKQSSLMKSKMTFAYEQGFLSSRMSNIYINSCVYDFNSPRCKYLQYQYSLLLQNVNQHNYFQVCLSSTNYSNLQQIDQCSYWRQTSLYWNAYQTQFHVDIVNKTWQICSSINYQINKTGSLQEYKQILKNNLIKVWLFNGDWDGIYSYIDTDKNMNKIAIKSVTRNPWFTQDYLSGFYQMYVGNLSLITIKGAGHYAVSNKPKQTYQMFYNYVKGRPINTPVF